MGQVLVRGLDDAVIERLRQRAEGHHRSLEAEVREILDQASRQIDVATARIWQITFAASSAAGRIATAPNMIREDRDR